MEEQVATSQYHSLILDCRVLCDEQSTFAFYGDTVSLLNYNSSQGVSKLPGLGYTDMQELLMSVHACTGFLT